MHDKVNIVLLTVDTLRAKSVSCYGYAQPTSPFLDELASQGVLAEHFVCTATPTHPSYTTLLTGQYPTTHNIVSHVGQVELAADAPFVSEVFAQSEYTTASVDNLPRQRSWFGRGFEYIIDPSVRRNVMLLIDGEKLNSRAIPWIREHKDEPFFLFMHYWDPHTPYAPPSSYAQMFYTGNAADPQNHSMDPFYERPIGALAQDTWLRTRKGPVTDAAYVAALYDREIRYVDDCLRALVTSIDELGLAEQTLIVVVGDHGESMTEHGIYFDHYGLYDTVLQVPMLMRLPGRLPAGRRLPRMLQHVDMAPTLLEAAGLTVPEEMEGKSFWRYATGAEAAGGYDAVVSVENTWQSAWSIRTDHYKFILYRQAEDDGTFRRELYDLEGDPDEEHDLATERPDVAAGLEARLEGWIADRLRAAGRTEDPLREQPISLHSMLTFPGLA